MLLELLTVSCRVIKISDYQALAIKVFITYKLTSFGNVANLVEACYSYFKSHFKLIKYVFRAVMKAALNREL